MRSHTTNGKKASQLFIWLLLLVTCPMAGQTLPVANFSIESTVCMNVTYTITDLSTNMPTAWSYTIDDGGFTTPSVVTVQNPVVSFAFPFSYTITQECTNGAGTSTPVSQVITVNFSPGATVTPQYQTMCAATPSVNLEVSSMFGPFFPLDYQWSNGATTGTIHVKPNVTTIYTCVVTDTMSGCSEVVTATVHVGEPSVNVSAIPASICPGANSALTASGTGPDPKTYVWSNGIIGAAFTSTLPGAYSVTMVNGIGCTATKTYNLANTCVGIDEWIVNDQLAMYPNPSAGNLTLKAASPLKVEIVDLTGKLVFETKLEDANEYQVNVSGLQSGIYVVRSSNGNKLQLQKLIVNP